MRPGHKNHFAFRIFNLESLKASEFIQTILSRVAVALVVRTVSCPTRAKAAVFAILVAGLVESSAFACDVGAGTFSGVSGAI